VSPAGVFATLSAVARALEVARVGFPELVVVLVGWAAFGGLEVPLMSLRTDVMFLMCEPVATLTFLTPADAEEAVGVVLEDISSTERAEW
jgi:hypothetical protein